MMFAIVGFDVGGPLNFCTVGRERKEKLVTYVSCELAVRSEQKPNACGRYELLASSNSAVWVRSVLTDTARMSTEAIFKDGDTLDIGAWVNSGKRRKPKLQGILFKQECRTRIRGKSFGILRCIGITRREMEFAQREGSKALVAKLRAAGVYPHTITTRKSVL
jgi:hypothetical protein